MLTFDQKVLHMGAAYIRQQAMASLLDRHVFKGAGASFVAQLQAEGLHNHSTNGVLTLNNCPLLQQLPRYLSTSQTYIALQLLQTH